MKKSRLKRDFFHGDSGIRTHDLLNAIQALSQLSYTPMRITLILYHDFTGK